MTPILYSFRRCPYAMRARAALAVSGVQVALREVVLRDKPQAFLDLSAQGTVPCLSDGAVTLNESLDIMIWALEQKDPERWLEMPPAGFDLIRRAEGPFKDALDRTKYATRFPECDAVVQRQLASRFLSDLNDQIDVWLYDRATLADYAILPFVRQFALIDRSWFDQQGWSQVQGWLDRFLDSERFAAIMVKYPQWQAGDPLTRFP